MKTCITLMAVLAIALFVGTGSASALVIDHFDGSTSFILTVDSMTAVDSQGPEGPLPASATDLTNNMRTETLTAQGVFPAGLQSRAVHTPDASTFVGHSNDTGVESSLLMEYMFDAADFTEGGGVGSLFVLFGASDLTG